MVFDEAPLFTSSPFRKNLALIPLMLRSLTRAKFVLLTATVPVSSENELLRGFGVPRATTVRMCTANFNLVHEVKRIARSAVGRADVTSFLQNQDDCAVIFVKSVAECEKLASSLNEMTEFRSQVAYYHAKLDGKERTDAHQAWKARRKRIMVATTAFAFGVDSANCNLAIHVDGAFDLASYCQGAGRAGRSGQRARSVMLLSSYRRTCGDGLLERYMMSTSKCRRVLLSEALDSKELVCNASCGECDNCTRLKLRSERIGHGLLERVHVRQGSMAIAAERSGASKRIARSINLNRKLQSRLKQHVQDGQCFVCTVVGKSARKHRLPQCPFFKNRCFRCGDKHRRSDCNIGKVWQKLCSNSAVCVTCCNPCDSMVSSFHLGEGTVGSKCKYKDTIVPACMALWHSRRREVLQFAQLRSISTDSHYAMWLCKMQDGVTNAARLVAHFLEKRYGR